MSKKHHARPCRLSRLSRRLSIWKGGGQLIEHHLFMPGTPFIDGGRRAFLRVFGPEKCGVAGSIPALGTKPEASKTLAK
jgi:hypothetical protein